jgi:hypothetical protein
MGGRDPEGRGGRAPSGKCVFVCACRCFRNDMHGGGATLRGPMSAGWCPHPTGPAVPVPPARTRAAAQGRAAFSGTGLAFRCRCGGAGAAPLGSDAAPTPHPKDGPPQARFHPQAGCRPARADTGARGFSGGWVRPCARRDRVTCQLSNVVAWPPPSPCRTLRQNPGGLPPAWSDTFPDPPAAGATAVWHEGWGWG